MRMRGFVTLHLKGRTMTIHGPLSVGVVRDMRVGVWPIEMVVMGVVRVAT